MRRPRRSVPRHTFDADASLTPVAYLAFRAGYTREEIDRTFRVVEKTTEDTARASVDLTGVVWMTVRGVYEHGQRRGSPVDMLELLSIGEQPGLRQFDISDRDRDRVSGIVTVTPIATLSVNGSLSYGKRTTWAARSACGTTTTRSTRWESTSSPTIASISA